MTEESISNKEEMPYTVRHQTHRTGEVTVRNFYTKEEAVAEAMIFCQGEGCSTIYLDGDPIASRQWYQGSLCWWVR